MSRQDPGAATPMRWRWWFAYSYFFGVLVLPVAVALDPMLLLRNPFRLIAGTARRHADERTYGPWPAGGHDVAK